MSPIGDLLHAAFPDAVPGLIYANRSQPYNDPFERGVSLSGSLYSERGLRSSA